MQVSVSNIELFRIWRDDDDLDLAWILNKILGPREQTPEMKAGEAFHKAIETAGLGEAVSISANGYHFDFNVDCDIEASRIKESSISAHYGDLLVRGRVDSLIGKLVIDYKTTQQFDADRLLTGYQWRFYLDMLDADRFRWNVFVIRETQDPMTFAVVDAHTLEQVRYPALHSDCLRLAKDYSEFAKRHLPTKELILKNSRTSAEQGMQLI